jgi:hypothetical protein
MNMKRQSWALGVAAIMSLWLAACSSVPARIVDPPAQPGPAPEVPGAVITDPIASPLQSPVDRGPEPVAGGAVGNTDLEKGTAVVDTAEVLMLESNPVQVSIQVKGSLGDACTRLGDVDVQRDGNAFLINVGTLRPRGRMCAQVISNFETRVALPLAGLQKGVYAVKVNTVERSFELTMDIPTQGAAQPRAADVPAAVTRALGRLADDLKVDAATLKVSAVEETVFPNACLGLPREGEMCAQVQTSGYRVTVQGDGKTYRMHTDAEGQLMRREP